MIVEFKDEYYDVLPASSKSIRAQRAFDFWQRGGRSSRSAIRKLLPGICGPRPDLGLIGCLSAAIMMSVGRDIQNGASEQLEIRRLKTQAANYVRIHAQRL